MFLKSGRKSEHPEATSGLPCQNHYRHYGSKEMIKPRALMMKCGTQSTEQTTQNTSDTEKVTGSVFVTQQRET